MAEVDTSSYPRATMPVSPLDMAQKFGNLQQQSLSINQQKLDQANQGLTYLTRAMASLGPDATKDQYKEVGANAVRMGLVPPEQLKVWNERVDAAPDSKSFYNELVTAAASHQEMLAYHMGTLGQSSTGQTVTPTVTSVKPGFGQRPIGMPVQQQAPPTTPVMGANNQPQLLGAQPPQVAPGSVAVPTPLPAVRPSLPVSGPTGPTVRRTDMEPTTFADRFPQPRGPITGVPPLFEEGKKQLTEDQALATQRMTAVKPAVQAYKLMKEGKLGATGPLTGQLTELTAAAKALGIIDTKVLNDPTVLRQELEKKLAQYVGSSPAGQRSDAAQVLAEAGSPNPKHQILPALINLTKDSIILDRVQAARPSAFEGTNYEKYGNHRATFPQSIDERAFGLDLMPKEEQTKLVDQMHDKYKKNPRNAEALKFFHSLDIAKKQGFFNAEQE